MGKGEEGIASTVWLSPSINLACWFHTLCSVMGGPLRTKSSLVFWEKKKKTSSEDTPSICNFIEPGLSTWDSERKGWFASELTPEFFALGKVHLAILIPEISTGDIPKSTLLDPAELTASGKFHYPDICSSHFFPGTPVKTGVETAPQVRTHAPLPLPKRHDRCFVSFSPLKWHEAKYSHCVMFNKNMHLRKMSIFDLRNTYLAPTP